MNLRELLERRTAITAELRQINDAHPDGALPAEAETRWTALRNELDSINARVDRQAVVDDAERRAAGQRIGGGAGDTRFDAELRQFSVVRAIAAAAGLPVDAGREREISAECARRSGRSFQGVAIPLDALAVAPAETRVTTTTTPAGGPGGNLVATQLLADQFIDRLRAALVIRRLGARILSGLVGNVAVPRLKGSATAQWVAENSGLTATDPQVDQVTLTPRTAGGIVEFSRTLLLQATPDAETIVRNDLTAILAQALDIAAINGAGSGSNQPRGILQTSGIGSVALGTNGAALAYDNVVDLMGQCQDANAENSNAFLTNYKVRRAVQKLKTTYNEPLGEDVVFQNTPRAFTNNVPYTLTKGSGTNLSALIYGDFSQILIGMWSELDLLVNPYAPTSYAAGNVQVRAMMTCDVAVRHPESFAAITDIIA